MQFENILYEVAESTAVITINRPKVLNALSIQTVNEICVAFGQAAADDAVKGIILTGAGAKSFAAGADIGEIRELDGLGGKEFAVNGQGVLNYVETCGKPSIAAVNGFALGGGCELAMACTMRVASGNARFGQPEVKLGIIPGYGGTQRLARLIGEGRAMEMILTGEAVTAEEAQRIGLVNKIFPQEELLAGAKEILAKVYAAGPVAVKFALEAVHRGLQGTLENGLKIEQDLFALTCGTEDMKEGTAAFMEKRKAEFKNN
jgi:enoyl-CoA hydratase